MHLAQQNVKSREEQRRGEERSKEHLPPSQRALPHTPASAPASTSASAPAAAEEVERKSAREAAEAAEAASFFAKRSKAKGFYDIGGTPMVASAIRAEDVDLPTVPPVPLDKSLSLLGSEDNSQLREWLHAPQLISGVETVRRKNLCGPVRMSGP